MQAAKRILSLTLALVLVLALAACGAQSSTATTAAPETTEAVAETAAETETEAVASHYPVTIENVNFELEKTEFTYEKAPEKVITFWTNSLETMLALGLGDRVMLAVGQDEDSILPELKDEYNRVKDNFQLYNDFLDSNAALSKESAVMMEPDFILAWKSSFNDKTLGDTTY